MSEHSIPEERTEQPTEKRMGQLRKEGAVHFSNDVVQVATLIAGFIMIQSLSLWLVEDMKMVLIKAFSMIKETEPLTLHDLEVGFLALLFRFVPTMLILVGIISTVAVLAVMLQTKWNVKEKKIKFNFAFINPIAGIKRIISIQGFVNFLKALAKLLLILPIGYFALKDYAPQMISLVNFNISQTMAFTTSAMTSIFWRIIIILIVLAVIDHMWSKYQWLRQNKMTKDEVKDERKSIEGDEATRKRIQAKGIQRIMQRILQSVPKADVVITNPTHYAVALKYDRATMRAPEVVAKGQGFVALRIREIAKQSGVPVLERKSLARALFNSVEVGSEIPYELFKAVAEVLAYVYRLRRPQSQARA